MKFRTQVGFQRALKLHHTRPFGNRISVSCHRSMKDDTLMQYDALGETETCAVTAQSDGFTGFQQLGVSIHISGHRRKCYWLVVHLDAFQSSINFAFAPLLSVMCISIAIHYLCPRNSVIRYGVKERVRVNVLLCLDNGLHFFVPVIHSFDLHQPDECTCSVSFNQLSPLSRGLISLAPLSRLLHDCP